MVEKIEDKVIACCLFKRCLFLCRLDPNDEYDNGAQHYCEVEENSRFQDLAQWEMYNKLLLSHGGSDMHSRYLLSKETLLSQLD